MYSLAKHPDIQERCRAEVDAILEGRDSDIIEWLVFSVGFVKKGRL